MRIKNTRELVLRADTHARHDRIVQGTYGAATVNGEVEFHGCAIGCLATPHRKRSLRSYLRAIRDGEAAGRCGLGSGDTFYIDSARQIRDLRREFGINAALARAAEDLFENQETHGAAIEFIPAFARALNEGANITPRGVKAAMERAEKAARTTQDRWGQWAYDEAVQAEHFLAWLREQR